MADYFDKIDEWRRAAERKARELNDQLDLRTRMEDGVRRAQEAARSTREVAEKMAEEADRLREETERLRGEAERYARENPLGEQLRKTAADGFTAAQSVAHEIKDETSRLSREAGNVAREQVKSAAKQAETVVKQAETVVKQAGSTLNEVGQQMGGDLGRVTEKFEQATDGARSYYDRAAKAYSTSATVARLSTATVGAATRAVAWSRAHPRDAAKVALSVAAGIRLGAAFPGLDKILLGSHPHWLTHSALPVWALGKISTAFDEHLREQERLIATGNLSEAATERVLFQRNLTKYVGAPLLGTFSCAMGITLWAQIFQPGRITGAPLSWLLGGNPVLDAIWLFGNGVVCFQQGYDFFMIALRDQEDVNRIVRELKGLLPAAATA